MIESEKAFLGEVPSLKPARDHSEEKYWVAEFRQEGGGAWHIAIARYPMTKKQQTDALRLRWGERTEVRWANPNETREHDSRDTSHVDSRRSLEKEQSGALVSVSQETREQTLIVLNYGLSAKWGNGLI